MPLTPNSSGLMRVASLSVRVSGIASGLFTEHHHSCFSPHQTLLPFWPCTYDGSQAMRKPFFQHTSVRLPAEALPPTCTSGFPSPFSDSPHRLESNWCVLLILLRISGIAWVGIDWPAPGRGGYSFAWPVATILPFDNAHSLYWQINHRIWIPIKSKGEYS